MTGARVPGPDDDLHGLAVAFARIEGKLDAALAQGLDHETRLRVQEGYNIAGLRQDVADLKQSVGSLKEWRAQLVGRAGAVGAGAGAVVAEVIRWVTHH